MNNVFVIDGKNISNGLDEITLIARRIEYMNRIKNDLSFLLKNSDVFGVIGEDKDLINKALLSISTAIIKNEQNYITLRKLLLSEK